MKCLRVFWLLLIGLFSFANVTHAELVYEDYTFTTFSGFGPGAEDGPARVARFNSPAGVARDASGNIYVADSVNHTIRKITPDGIVSTLAGLAGSPGSADGVGSAARFYSPYGVAVDSAGNVYVADTGNSIIRKITPTGIVTTLAGSAGNAGSANGQGSGATFSYPYGVAVSGGNIYVADSYNYAIRKVTPTGAVTTFAGLPGVFGTNNANGTSARFNVPFGIAADLNGNLFVADTGNQTIRKITSSGAVTTLAGMPGTMGSDDGTNSSARFQVPYGIAADGSGNIYVADTYNQTIRKISPAGVVTTLAGTAGMTGGTNAVGGDARFDYPVGLAADSVGNLYVGDFVNDAIRQVTPAASVTTFAGTGGGSGQQDGNTNSARFYYPAATATDPSGNVFVADESNHTIRKITPAGIVSTFAGTAGVSGTNDGMGLAAKFHNPIGVAVDSGGNVYVVDRYNHAIRKITSGGLVTTLAGLPGTAGTNDGVGIQARFNEPFGIAVDVSSNVYVGDTHNHAVRKITPDGTVTTLAGLLGSAGGVDGTNSTARFSFPEGLAVDPDGNIFVADDGNFTIRKVTPDGVVTTYAGTTGQAGAADGIGTAAKFSFPFGVAIDAARNLYIADAANQLIRKITPSRIVTTLAGKAGVSGYWDGTGDGVRFSSPEGLTMDSGGNLYVADSANQTIRKGYPAVLPDLPVIDIANGPVGLTRHLSVSNSTAATRQWSIIRYPSASTAQLSSTNATSLTFTPDVEDTYVIRFEAWDNSGHYTARTLTIYADNTAPTAIFTNAFSGMTWSNAIFTVKGVANDNLQLSNVWVQVNNGSWAAANGTSAWSYDAALTPGTNVIRVYAQDASGLVSTTNTINIKYIVSAPIDFQITGGGTVTPNYSNAVLEIGKSYTVTAKPPVGYLFVNWTGTNGTVLSTSATYTFVMATNLILHANFMLNPFVAGQGTFAGLFYDTNGVTAANAGYFTAKLTSKGTFSAKLTLSGASVSVGGTVSAGGAFSNSVALKTGGSITVQLQFDLSNDAVTGTVANSGAGWTSQLQGFRNVYSKTNLSALGGKRFSVVIPGAGDSSVAPGGYSYGSALISTMGGVTFSGVLADGSKATQKTYMSKQGQWPFFLSPYKGHGIVIGWLTVSNQVNSDLSGTVNWIKLPIAGAKYPNGFQITTNAVGSFYTFTSGVPVLNLPSGGVAILAQGNLSQSLTNTFTMDATSKVTSADGLSMTVTTSTGLFKGTAPNPATGSSVPFTGVILQKQNAGFGNFQGATQSGRVYIGE